MWKWYKELVDEWIQEIKYCVVFPIWLGFVIVGIVAVVKFIISKIIC